MAFLSNRKVVAVFMEFWNTHGGMILASAALLTVGLNWTITGVVMGEAPKKNIHAAAVMLTSSGASTILTLIMLLFTGLGKASTQSLLISGAFLWGAGALNGLMLNLMSNAMQKGPNGIIWATVQSAMIFPFLMGVFFFDVEPRVIRFVGLFSIIVSLVLSGLARENNQVRGNWKLLTLVAFLLTGGIQCLVNGVSYFKEAELISPIYRTMMTSAGVTTMAAYRLWRFRKTVSLMENLKNKRLWYYLIALTGIGLICAILLQYPAMDKLAQLGAGSLSYPLMVSACVVGFAVYSIVVLREKPSPVQVASLCCCTAGIIMICL